MFRYSFVSNTILQATITQMEGKVQRRMKKARLHLTLSLSHKDCPLVYRQCQSVSLFWSLHRFPTIVHRHSKEWTDPKHNAADIAEEVIIKLTILPLMIEKPKAPLFCNLLNYELVYYEFVIFIFIVLSTSHLFCH